MFIKEVIIDVDLDVDLEVVVIEVDLDLSKKIAIHIDFYVSQKGVCSFRCRLNCFWKGSFKCGFRCF